MAHHHLLKVRVYPSLDFTLGANTAPRRDSEKCGTEFEKDSYRDGIYQRALIQIKNNDFVNQRAIAAAAQGNLGEDKAIALFNAYEEKYLKAKECGDIAASQEAINQIEALMKAPSLLGLSVAINSHSTPRARRGLNGISPYAKRMVRSGLALLERHHGRKCLTLGTCTLPALSPDEMEAVCSNWAELVRQFFQQVTRELERRDLPGEYVQVTEIQEKRFSRLSEVGLHLHWVIPGRKHRSLQWAFSPGEIRSIWARLLFNMIGREVDCAAATRIEAPRSSLAQELGKYLSKGVGAIQAVVKAGKESQLPSSWWGASLPLKREIKSEILEISGPAAYWLDRQLAAMKEADRLWYVDIWIENDGHEFRAGAVGRFNSRRECDELVAYRDSCPL